jgi:peptide chain release factor 1
MKAILEIRAGEGGEDAKLFIFDMLKMYSRYCDRSGIKYDLIHKSESEISISIDGDIDKLLKYESGVHRIQRVPPTESKGRRHSSTITVAVLPIDPHSSFSLNMSEIKIETFRGRGPGGQHRNTSDTGVKAIHEPTNTVAICSKGRSQYKNKQIALEVLSARLEERDLNTAKDKRQKKRREKIGHSERSEKIRTYNFIENRIKDIRVGKTLYVLDKVMQGNLDRIYCKMGK